MPCRNDDRSAKLQKMVDSFTLRKQFSNQASSNSRLRKLYYSKQYRAASDSLLRKLYYSTQYRAAPDSALRKLYYSKRVGVGSFQ